MLWAVYLSLIAAYFFKCKLLCTRSSGVLGGRLLNSLGVAWLSCLCQDFLSFDTPLWIVAVLIEGSLLLYQPPKKAQDTLDWNFIDSLTRLFLLSLVIPAIFTGSGFYNSCFVMFYYVRHTQELPPAPSQLKQWLEKTVDSLAPQPASVRVS